MCADCRAQLQTSGFSVHQESTHTGNLMQRLKALDEPERYRAREMSGLRRDQFITGRWLLRSMLGAITECDPARIPLSASCPRCASELHGPVQARMPGTDLSVSLSHSKHIVLAAVARTQVGVDVEFTGKVTDLDVLEVLVFGQVLTAGSIEDRRSMVTRAWCRGEALAKAAGLRLNKAFEALRGVDPLDDLTIAGRPGFWRIRNLPDPAPTSRAAIATRLMMAGAGARPSDMNGER